MTATLSHRKELCFWGWGYSDEGLSQAEEEQASRLAAMLGAATKPGAPPVLGDFDLPSPRVAGPNGLSSILSASPYDRITHGYGKSFADLVRMQMREMPNPPDWVAFPRSEDDILCPDGIRRRQRCTALIPFGGGTSVCGGVEPDVGGDYARGDQCRPAIPQSRAVEVDKTSRAAH